MPADDLLPRLEALHGRAYGWALVCCGRDRELAADVLQSSYARILGGRAAWGEHGELRAFLFGVVKRVSAEALRSARREAQTRDSLRMALAAEPGSGAYGARTAALDLMERDETHHALRRCLAGLPERQREVLHLTFYQGLSLAEAAEVLDIHVGSARQHYARGKAALRAHCEPLVRDRA